MLPHKNNIQIPDTYDAIMISMNEKACIPHKLKIIFKQYKFLKKIFLLHTIKSKHKANFLQTNHKIKDGNVNNYCASAIMK